MSPSTRLLLCLFSSVIRTSADAFAILMLPHARRGQA